MPIATNDDAKPIAISGNIPASDGKTTLPLFTKAGWRIEVTGNGKNWNWRKGSGNGRKSRYGGTFNTLSETRQAEYQQNKLTHSRSNTRDITGQPAVLSIIGD